MRVAVDTGGTFTDVVFLEKNYLYIQKVSSTPSEPSQAVLNALSICPNYAQELIHGTTIATNAFLERKGAKTALITTAGFEDILFIGRQARPKLYDFNVEKPKPFIAKEHCLGIKERICIDGTILSRPEKKELEYCVSFLKKEGIESVAICFLHAYLYPIHEKLVKEFILKNLYLPISISSEILPEFREFERASTTAINAYLTPLMYSYLKTLKEKLKNIKLRIQQSNGGWLTVEEAYEMAVHTVLSGPAGGVNGAIYWAKNFGEKKIITFDMGGTSTDVCLVDEKLPFTKEYILDGFPLSLPVVDIHTVGAGGGSIAYLDAGGALKVGPQSAGADPGPACYGKGMQPTVTDANLILGRLLPDKFLGGRIKLDKERAIKAIYPLAKSLNLKIEEIALGIIQVANINMIKALRAISLERGFDPKFFTLVCFGGAGGLHACALARELNVKQTMIPRIASVLSALGLLVAAPIKDFSRTVWIDVNKDTEKKLKEIFNNILEEAINKAKKAGFKKELLNWEFFLDMRYCGQGYEITVPYNSSFIETFYKEHKRFFGHFYEDFPVEIVTVRLRLKAKEEEIKWSLPEPAFAPYEETKVYTTSGWLKVPIIPWDNLKIGDKFRGPAIIWEPFSTVWVEPDFNVEVKEDRTLFLKYVTTGY